MTAAIGRPPLVFAGFPGTSWAFAVRTWIAMVLALYASFWLQLESPATSALTVAILAFPTRGQGMERAAFRLLGTAAGVAASIVIFGLFAQSEGLLLAVLAVWTGLCVYAAGLLDGNRAYGAALGVITVGLIAIQQIDSPQNIFDAGLARGAGIAIGVLASMLVNDLLASPDLYPRLAGQLESLHRRVVDYARDALRGQAAPSTVAAGLLREITALRPDIASLAAESSDGVARSTAARNAMVGLVAELSVARLLARSSTATAQLRTRLAAELDGTFIKPPASSGSRIAGREEASSDSAPPCLAPLQENLQARSSEVLESLDALRSGALPSRIRRAPLYRSHRIAAENGVRAAIYLGWPRFSSSPRAGRPPKAAFRSSRCSSGSAPPCPTSALSCHLPS